MSNGSIAPLKLQLEAFLATPSLRSPSLRPAHREGEPPQQPNACDSVLCSASPARQPDL